jgi:hypothetical protein
MRHDEGAWQMCDILTCTCCGKGLPDTPEANVSHAEVPYPHDTGFGLCRQGGGDPNADMTTEDGVRKRMGWQMTAFCEARFDVVRKHLKPEQQAKWDGLSYAKKCAVVLGLVREGAII